MLGRRAAAPGHPRPAPTWGRWTALIEQHPGRADARADFSVSASAAGIGPVSGGRRPNSPPPLSRPGRSARPRCAAEAPSTAPAISATSPAAVNRIGNTGSTARSRSRCCTRQPPGARRCRRRRDRVVPTVCARGAGRRRRSSGWRVRPWSSRWCRRRFHPEGAGRGVETLHGDLLFGIDALGPHIDQRGQPRRPRRSRTATWRPAWPASRRSSRSRSLLL